MEENTSKVLVAADANLAAATLMNASGPGSSLFVINLCAGMAPIANVGKSLPGLGSYRLYQVARREDGRTRYRLRLGFFANEADAKAVLNLVRNSYPTAFTACLCDEDQKFARGYVAEPLARAVPTKIAVVVENKNVVKPAAATAIKPAATIPAAKPPAKPVAAPTRPAASAPRPATAAPVAAPKAAASKPSAEAKAPPKRAIEAPSKLLASIELTLETEQKALPSSKPPATPSNEPFRVGRGVEIPATSLTLESTQSARAPAAKPAMPAPKAPAQPTAEVSRMKAAQATAAAIKASVAPAAQKPVTKLPDLDSTQTIRALTSDELTSESQEKWFAIQLAASDQPVNLDAMPHLDIFEAYRLYSVASAGNGKITHSLRIGFFREEVSAEAVCGYLKTFFASPTVVRISIAEQTRFKDAPTPKPAPKAEVLDLNHARDRAPKAVPSVTMEVAPPRFDSNATGSFKTSATGMHKALSSGPHKALSATGMHRALGATGTNQALKAASPAMKRSAPLSKTGTTGKYKAQQPKTLAQQLLDEAREVELSKSGIRKLPKNDSLLSKMFGRKK